MRGHVRGGEEEEEEEEDMHEEKSGREGKLSSA